jgi:LmbE family N-acetylglucosaminyl deacetylase
MSAEDGPSSIEVLLRSVKRPLAGAMGTSIGHRAVDVTEEVARRSCLVLAPHPDDETLGCGATIMRKVSAGTPVHVLVLTDGATWPPWNTPADNIAIRDTELRAACGVLGLQADDLTHLAFPETELQLGGEALVEAVADAVRIHQPDDVLATSEADPHSDHAALGSAVRRALAGRATRLLSYPIWQWERPRSWLRTMRLSARPEVVGTAGYLDGKRAAVAVYRSQISTGSGNAKTEGLEPWFLRHFLGPREMFFPVTTAAGPSR